MKRLAVILVLCLAATALWGCTYSGEKAEKRFLKQISAINEANEYVKEGGNIKLGSVSRKVFDVTDCTEDDYSSGKTVAVEGFEVEPHEVAFMLAELTRVENIALDAVEYFCTRSGSSQMFTVKYKRQASQFSEYITASLTFKDGKLTFFECLVELTFELPYKNKLTGKVANRLTVWEQTYYDCEFYI